MFFKPSEQRHPLSAVNSIIVLLLLIVAGVLVAIFLASLIIYIFYGASGIEVLSSGGGNNMIQKIFLGFTSLGLFVLPPLFFARIKSKSPFAYLEFTIPRPIPLLFLALLIMFCATPFIEWTVFLNQEMKLPGFLKSVENWMKQKELAAEVLTRQLLVMKSLPDLLLNLLIIAAIPALGEELMFRGCVQKLITNSSRNYHLGIWISAILFSIIHVQFYGFIPRMLLGALFGYLLVWGKSIWLPILAHFYNNASVVIAAYVYQKQGKSIDELTKGEAGTMYMVIPSLIITVGLFWLFRTIALKYRGSAYGRELG